MKKTRAGAVTSSRPDCGCTPPSTIRCLGVCGKRCSDQVTFENAIAKTPQTLADAEPVAFANLTPRDIDMIIARLLAINFSSYFADLSPVIKSRA